MRARMVDYLMDCIYDAGAHHVFFVPGTGCMFLTDALARKKELNAISVHHEQAAGMAALTYAKRNETLGACVVTTGCGGTNAVTACLHAWQDNVPCVFISGQAARNQTVRNAPVPLRQMGRQEADIISIVESITKYSVMLNDPEEVAFEIAKAIYIAKEGRKGPVWIDVPMDIQNAIIDTDTQKQFVAPEINLPKVSDGDMAWLKKELESAKRPVLMIGQGVRMSGAIKELNEVVEKYQIPVVYSRLGHDVLDTDHPLSIGMVGMLGASRAGNFAVQNADFVLCVGSRLSIDTTGYEYEKFARAAKLVVVDIDEKEHQKQTVKIDKFICSDAKYFLSKLLNADLKLDIKEYEEKCRHWKEIFPICNPYNPDSETIDMYYFVDSLSKVLPDNATVISDAGNSFFTVSPTVRTKRSRNQRSITSGGQAEMGYSLPASIGAAYAEPNGPVAAISGDGSVMMNIQEFETLAYNKPNVKLFIMNNNGYSSIRHLQVGAFRGRVIGCDPSCGIGFPMFGKVAEAFGLQYVKLEGSKDLPNRIEKILDMEGPVVCEVMSDTEQQFLNVSTAKNSQNRIVTRPLEDQAPFLDRELFNSEMIIDPLD